MITHQCYILKREFIKVKNLSEGESFYFSWCAYEVAYRYNMLIHHTTMRLYF